MTSVYHHGRLITVGGKEIIAYADFGFLQQISFQICDNNEYNKPKHFHCRNYFYPEKPYCVNLELKLQSTSEGMTYDLRFQSFRKISNTFLVLFSNKMLVVKVRIHKTLVRIANKEEPDQTASEAVRQAV